MAAEDVRISSLALVNIGYFLWDGSKSLAEVIAFSQRSVADLGATLLRRDGLRRLLSGRLDVRGAWRFLGRQASRHLVRRNAAFLGRLTSETRRYHDAHALFARLRQRDVRLLLIYSEGDRSIDELRSFMGTRLAKLGRYPNMAVTQVDGADHNFTHRSARDGLLDVLMAFASRVPGLKARDQGGDPVPAQGHQRLADMIQIDRVPASAG